MKSKVYIETTIPSYLVVRPSRDLLIAARQQLTRDWWDSRGPQFDLYISEPVLEEAAAGDAILAKRRLELLADIRVLALTEGIMKLAEILVAEGPIPPKARGRCASHCRRDGLRLRVPADWNCRHIANAEIQRAARLVVKRHGFELPAICTPEELMGEEE